MTKRPTVRTTTGATVTLTIEISNIGSWGRIARSIRFITRPRKRQSAESIAHLRMTNEASGSLARWS